MKKILIILFVFTSLTYSQTIEYSGWGAGGYKMFARNQLNGYNQEAFYSGKIQLDFEYNSDIEAQLDLRGNSADKSITLKEFSAKFKYIKKLKIKFGNTKRPFGYQYTELNREDLMTIERSLPVEKINGYGYGGRTLSIVGYYKYKDKNDDYPYSYYVSFFADNSLNQGIAGRFAYHLGKSAIAVSALTQKRGGDEPISTTGYGLDYSYESKKWRGVVEFSYTGNPDLGVTNRLANKDENVYTLGATIGASYKFDLDAEVIKDIEPVLLTSYYAEDASVTGNHILQGIAGVNIYFHKKVLARLNADIRLTKNQYNDTYTSNESRGIFELLVKF